MKRSIFLIAVLALAMFLSAGTSWAAEASPRVDYTPEPSVEQFEGVSYVSGGLGSDQREDMRGRYQDFSLKLVFARSSGEYLADVEVKIVDDEGRLFLSTVTTGPWLYVQLPSGHYQVLAFYDLSMQQKDISLKKGRQEEVYLRW